MYDFYKVDKLRGRVEKAVEYFSPFGVFFWFFKIVAMILLQVSPFDKMLDLHQNWDCDKGGSIESGILCSQRYAPVSLSIYWSFQMFFSLLPFFLFLVFAKRHITRNEELLAGKKRTRVVNSQIAIIVEDGKIRNVKIFTLILQIALEVASLIALAWLQMRRHNMETIFGTATFWDVLFRIPEKYECQIGAIREHTFFNRSWDQLGLYPCNNDGDKITCWTNRSVESTLMHSTLLIIMFLSIDFAICELFYNVVSLSKKPARKLSKKMSTKIDVLFHRNSNTSLKKKEREMAANFVQEEIRASNYNLTRASINDNYDC